MMIRKIIKPTSESYNIHIPREYIDTEVEILVLPFGSKEHNTTHRQYSETEAYSNHTANTIEEWLDDNEDEIWN